MRTITAGFMTQAIARPGAANFSWRAALKHIVVWYQRHEQRSALSALDDNQLLDLGISKSEADRESRKPFWQP